MLYLLKIKGLIVLKLEEFIELPKEEQEKNFGEATRKAIAETHAAGRPSCHGDNKGFMNFIPMALRNILNYTKRRFWMTFKISRADAVRSAMDSLILRVLLLPEKKKSC